MWEILYTDQFGQWWGDLTEDQQEALRARVELLEERGPDLGRPVVDTIVGSRHQNMKELRASKGAALRVLFIFDPLRRALLLLGGDKSGRWERWYQEAIPQADALYDEYLQELRDEGVIP